MKILSLQLKNKRDANVFLAKTDEGEFELFSDVIVQNGIAVGNIDDKKFYVSVRESAEKIAFNRATKYISSKLKTERQIKDYLYKHGYHKDVVEAVLIKLNDYGVINDQIYADSYIKSNLNFSKKKLKQKLSSVGIKKENLEESIEDVDDTASCLNNAKKFMRNKVLDEKTREKLIRRLTYLGYGWDTINSTLRKLLDNNDEMC